jgi:uncharacterized protein YkwD
MRRIIPLLAFLSLIPGGSLCAQDLRGELLKLINRERREAGSPPLRLSRPLTQAAQEHAEEIASRGSSRLQAGPPGAMQKRIDRAGYDAHAWVESLSVTPGDADDAIRSWKRDDPQTFRRLLSAEYRDLGIGLDRLRGTPLYVFLFAVPQGDYFTRETGGLRDLDRVRAEMLARVNEARRKASIKPLRSNSRLDRAAQRHAEDMLARGYFAHESPEGDTVRQRSKEARYNWRTIGENIAEGQFTVDEVMTTWLNSPGHRRNILDPRFEELGVGLALGRANGRYRVLWAQAFGTPR